jgi:hypothetical protein
MGSEFPRIRRVCKQRDGAQHARIGYLPSLIISGEVIGPCAVLQKASGKSRSAYGEPPTRKPAPTIRTTRWAKPNKVGALVSVTAYHSFCAEVEAKALGKGTLAGQTGGSRPVIGGRLDSVGVTRFSRLRQLRCGAQCLFVLNKHHEFLIV